MLIAEAVEFALEGPGIPAAWLRRRDAFMKVCMYYQRVTACLEYCLEDDCMKSILAVGSRDKQNPRPSFTVAIDP
jgi:hypothetical protein